MKDVMTSVCVKYKYVDGWHVFASDDVEGLYVASKDAKLAFDDVGPSITLLLKLNEGIECVVKPEMPFANFLRFLKEAEQKTQIGKRKAKPIRQSSSSEGLSNRLFAVYPANLLAA